MSVQTSKNAVHTVQQVYVSTYRPVHRCVLGGRGGGGGGGGAKGSTEPSFSADIELKNCFLTACLKTIANKSNFYSNNEDLTCIYIRIGR